MNGKRWITKLWLSIIGFTLLAMSVAHAQDTPIKLMAVKVELGGSVRLAWTRPANVTIDSFFVYRAEGDNISKAVRIVGTKDTTYTDILPMTFVAVSKYSYYVVGKPTAGALLTSNTIVIPMAGIPPIGSFRLTAAVDEANALVKLSWTKPPVDSVVKYYVYRYGGFLSSIQLIDSTTGLTSTDKPPVTSTGGGMMGGNYTDDAGKFMFTYYVKAKLPIGASLQSTSATVLFTITVKKDIITFLTAPVTTAQVNVPYTAKVLAKSSDSTAKLTYVLDQYPNGMTLDVSGAAPLLKWTPKNKGMYGVRVIVKSDKNGTARQDYSISVAGGNGIVHGKVTDTTLAHTPIANVIVQIMERDRDSHFNYSTVTNEFGEYRFSKLDPGLYILQAIPTKGNFIGQWWDGKYNADKADTLRVIDSTSLPSGAVANFILRGRAVDTTKYVIVKGAIRDTLLLPVTVKGTQITFVRAEFALNSSTSATDVTIDNFKKFFDYDKATDFRIEGGSKYTFRAPLDSLGNYSLKIPQGSYIALARAPGYAAEFYKEHADLLSADIMKLSADSSNINFTLAPLPPVALSTMSGSVMDTVKNIGVRARILAFRDGWNMRDGFKMAKAYFTDTDSTGAYSFTELLPGSYIVMAVPVGNYVPAYYTGGVQTAGQWNKVSKVVVDSGKSISGIDIVVKEISATKGGFTWITGTVKVKGKAFGLAGALVFAHDANGEPAGYGVSDNSGNYAILGLAPGSYSVSVDKPGYTSTVTQIASPSYNMASMGVNTVGVSNISFSLDAVDVVTSATTQTTAAVPSTFTVGQNYPNPFNPSTKFQFMLPTAQLVKVKVYDLLGREVATLVNRQMTAGSYTIEWNASSMPSGVYFYRVEAGASSLVKKMILMK
jgi:hypothetical protein